MKINPEKLKVTGAIFLFWSWHIIYLIVAVALIIPYMLIPMLGSIFDDRTPVYYSVYIFVIVLLPFVSIAIVSLVFKNNHKYVMRYFYGFEMPLLFFILVKIATFRELNFNTDLLIANVVIALTFWLYFLWIENKQQAPVALLNKPWMLAGSTIISIVGVYFGVLFFIYLLPVAVDFITGLIHALSHISSADFTDLLFGIINPIVWLSVLFVLFTASLFLALPVVMVWLYLKQFKQFIPQLRKLNNIAIVSSIILLNIALFTYGYQQPQTTSFTLLSTKHLSTQEQQHLVEKSDDIRAGLLNAYLAPYRYVSSTKNSKLVAYQYKKSLGFNDEFADNVQSVFNFLASPLLYQGDIYADNDKAEKYYEDFFDAPIQKAERQTIINAIKHKWEIGASNEASLLSTNSHFVHSDEQIIDLQVNQNVATITITESLKNLSQQNKEAVIHFSLPEDAVVTGLWLSSDKNNPEMYPYVLAPKGAAQAVYKAEVNRRVDPALLEQVGPQQYRLRVYPVPPKRSSEYFQMRFQYQTLANNKGEWPLPIVLEKRNIFWDKETKRIINNVSVDNVENTQQWIPTLTKNTNTIKAKVALQHIAFQQDKRVIQAVARQHQAEKPILNKPIAVLIDGSYSMNRHQLALTQAIEKLKLQTTKVDFYFCRLQCEAIKDTKSLHFFANSQTADQLTAFIKTGKTEQYAAVLLLSDAGSYELQAKNKTEDLPIKTPVWLVHLSKNLPYAYDDKVLDLLYRSKGGVTQSVTEALLRANPIAISQAAHLSDNDILVAISKDRVWFSNTDNAEDNILAVQKIAAAQEIKYLTHNMDMQQLNNLDGIHNYAKKNGIISHYSSMLVLVNDQQKQALKKAEEGADRFDREIETGKKKGLVPHDPFAVPSVPEPEEWALIIIMTLLLIVAYIRRKRGAI